MTKRELQQQIDNLNFLVDKLESKHASQRAILDIRWKLLKDYLGVKEEDYAELVNATSITGFGHFENVTRSVKKTRLVKIKK